MGRFASGVAIAALGASPRYGILAKRAGTRLRYNCQMSRPLASLRQNWEKVELEEARLLSDLTFADSISQYLEIQREFEDSLEATERFFREERLAHLAQLQLRLLRLNDLKGHR